MDWPVEGSRPTAELEAVLEEANVTVLHSKSVMRGIRRPDLAR
jgi:hypothetical protein